MRHENLGVVTGDLANEQNVNVERPGTPANITNPLRHRLSSARPLE
jgi:hypothetical protein